ncbi:MAG: TlpA family protein disulfide reductase [Gammaproteobacteria bacterium]
MRRYSVIPLLRGLLICCCALAQPGWAVEPPALPGGILELAAHAAPETVLDDLDGEPYDLRADLGEVVFVHFWASWCGPCREEMPAIQRMWEELEPEGLRIALINTAEDEETVFSFLAAHAPDIRPLMDRDGLVTELWSPRGLPATYLVDRRGRVRYQALGGRPWDGPEYRALLRRLLAEPAS